MQFSIELIEQVEKKYLDLLVGYLQRGEITADQAKAVTREFLEMTPFTSQEDLDEKIQKFTTEHPEFGTLYVDLMKLEADENTQETIDQMRELIKQNRLDEAVNLVNNE